MSVGSSYWCRPTPTTEHRSTSSLERRPTPSDKHRSTPLLGSDKIVRIQSHSDFTARHPHPPTRARVKLKEVDRQQHERIDRQQQERIDRQQHGCIDRQEQPKAPEQEQSTLAETSLVEIDQCQWDGYEPSMEKQETEEGVQSEKRVKSSKVFIPKYLWREVNKVELDGFHKRVKRVPKDMSFEDAYYKYRLGNFFIESRETDKDIEIVRCREGSESFTKVRVLCDPELREKGEVSARAFINCINKMRKRDTETCSGASKRKRPEEDEFARGSTMDAHHRSTEHHH
uniref:Uncharacterized protein n=1 Tax=Brassica oleracea var. oleracea TaxID=109376 RepID=A0A0D3DKK2_BRAOL